MTWEGKRIRQIREDPSFICLFVCLLHPPDRPLPLIDSIIPWNYLYFTVWMRYFVHAGEWIVSVLRICCSSRKMSWAAGWLKIMRARHRQNGWWGEEEEEGCGTVKFSGQTKRNISLLFCFIADIQPAGCYAFLTPNGRTHAGPPIICLSIYIYICIYIHILFFFLPPPPENAGKSRVTPWTVFIRPPTLEEANDDNKM